MERSAIFVDAGYLLAAGGSLVCGTSSRAGFRCDYAGVTSKLANWAEQHNRGRFQCLRTYWYDGAPQGVARGDHELIGGLPYVKVRLGRLLHGEQKGVDALIYRDLMTLARERAVSCAYLLSGDEDLREGVVAAQDMGLPGPVFAYLGSTAARERCRAGIAAGDVCIGSGYLEAVRAAFAALGGEALAEFERTTGPPPFPVRDLERVYPGS
jgi:hypothetical protein